MPPSVEPVLPPPVQPPWFSGVPPWWVFLLALGGGGGSVLGQKVFASDGVTKAEVETLVDARVKANNEYLLEQLDDRIELLLARARLKTYETDKPE